MFIKLTRFDSKEFVYINSKNIFSFSENRNNNGTSVTYGNGNPNSTYDTFQETPEQIMELINNG